MHRLKKKIYFVMYKLTRISRETWRENGVEVIVFNDKKWLNETNIKKQLGHANLAAVTLQYPSKYRKQRQELQQNWKGKFSNTNNNGL